jgi:hypothetical protein
MAIQDAQNDCQLCGKGPAIRTFATRNGRVSCCALHKQVYPGATGTMIAVEGDRVRLYPWPPRKTEEVSDR